MIKRIEIGFKIVIFLLVILLIYLELNADVKCWVQ